MATIPDGVRDRAGWVDLKEVDEHGEGLTQFEIDFVESLHGWLLSGMDLTDKQRSTLERIRAERL
jgi:hypothetical protein